jgi:hypothetical protein
MKKENIEKWGSGKLRKMEKNRTLLPYFLYLFPARAKTT